MKKREILGTQQSVFEALGKVVLQQGQETFAATVEIQALLGDLNFILGYILGQMMKRVGAEKTRYLLMATVDAMERLGQDLGLSVPADSPASPDTLPDTKTK